MDEAVADYGHAIESLPNDRPSVRDRAYANQRLGHFREASADLSSALDICPNDAETLTQARKPRRRARRLRTGGKEFSAGDHRRSELGRCSSQPGLAARHLPQSRCLQPTTSDRRRRACGQAFIGDDYLIFDTLAAALRSAGQFKQAIEIEQKAVAIAPPDLAPTLQQRLGCYHRGIAYRPSSPSSRVRHASHESPADSSTTDIEFPTAQVLSPRCMRG